MTRPRKIGIPVHGSGGENGVALQRDMAGVDEIVYASPFDPSKPNQGTSSKVHCKATRCHGRILHSCERNGDSFSLCGCMSSEKQNM